MSMKKRYLILQDGSVFAHDKGSYIWFYFYKMFIYVVQQFCLFHRVSTFS